MSVCLRLPSPRPLVAADHDALVGADRYLELAADRLRIPPTPVRLVCEAFEPVITTVYSAVGDELLLK